MKIAMIKTTLASLALLPGLTIAAPAVADKADSAFMMICTALVLFMTIPGIALFYGGLIRAKNVLSMLTQVTVTFALVCILWVVYGYSLAFGEGNHFFGNTDGAMLKNIALTAVTGTIYQYIHVAFQGSFACITVGLIVGALAERIRFSAVLIFVVVWFTLSYIPIAHMVWGGGLLAAHGALVIGVIAGLAGLWGVTMLKRLLRVDDPCDVFGVHGVCGIVGCILTGVFAASSLGGVGFVDGVTMGHQVMVQLESIAITVVWSGVVAFVGYKLADILVGLRVPEEQEREGLDVNSHGENAYNA
ncbi:hypothetical protein Q6M76_002352 [Salmonella enterica]|nr:hypothetical protein [Salmonella enterica]ELL2010660.1 hypothetical protein [Salmonella enterica]